MSFRQQNKDAGKVWRRSHRSELLSTGLPDFIIDSESRWNHLLLHGYDPESGWAPSRITRASASELLRLLDSHYETRSAMDLFVDLETRVSSSNQAT